MSTPSFTSTPDSRSMALAMFAGQVPCIFQVFEPSCAQRALWLGYMVHEEPGCDRDEPMPLCQEHKQVMQQAGSPFWRTWFGAQPVPCGGCGAAVRVGRFEVIS